MLIKETSERSDKSNWVKMNLLNSDIKIIEFEGYTVKNDKVSVLLDRALIETTEDFKEDRIDRILEELIKIENEHTLLSKVKFSKKISAPYLYILYSYRPERVYIYTVYTEDNNLSVKLWKNTSFFEFALYLSKNRDQWMKSRYEESGLPLIDKMLRLYNNYSIGLYDVMKSIKFLLNLVDIIKEHEIHMSQNQKVYFDKALSNIHRVKQMMDKQRELTSVSYKKQGEDKQINIFDAVGKIAWPGNLDGLVIDEDGEAKALIEFQTVTKGSVLEHCNNTWFFKTQRNRKDDQKRWKVVYNIWKSSKLPLYIIVWSPNETNIEQKNIKFKEVQDILFNENGKELGIDKGLIYNKKEMMTINELIKELKF